MTTSAKGFFAVCALTVWLNIGFGKHCGTRLNLALHKSTAQSGTFQRAEGKQAVDGIRTGDHYDCNSCTRTIGTEQNPWWMVDLEQEFMINEVIISNTVAILRLRLHHFQIKISKHGSLNGSMVSPEICAKRSSSQPAGSTVSYPCTSGSVPGRYVQITMNSGVLALCEVQIFGPYYGPRASCEDTFILYQRNFSPAISPIFSATTRTVPVCAALCLAMEFCTSFTVKDTGENTQECKMYECQPARNSIIGLDTDYFLLASLYKSLK